MLYILSFLFLLVSPLSSFFGLELTSVIALSQTPGREFLLRVSYLEIYNEVQLVFLLFV